MMPSMLAPHATCFTLSDLTAYSCTILFANLFDVFLYGDELKFGPVNIVKDTEMRIVGDDELSIPTNGTVNKLVIIWVSLNQIEKERW